jgi:hypothetical protein
MDNTKKSSHLLRDCQQFIDIHKFYESGNGQTQLLNPPPPPQHQVQQFQTRASNEAFPPPRG